MQLPYLLDTPCAFSWRIWVLMYSVYEDGHTELLPVAPNCVAEVLDAPLRGDPAALYQPGAPKGKTDLTYIGRYSASGPPRFHCTAVSSNASRASGETFFQRAERATFHLTRPC